MAHSLGDVARITGQGRSRRDGSDPERGMKKLLAVDGSEHAQQALRETIERVAETGDDLDVAIYAPENTGRTLADVRGEVDAILAATDLDVGIRRLEGHVGSELVEMADSEGYDRLLIGVRTTTPLGKIHLGTVAEFVVLNAETTVTLVRTSSPEARQSATRTTTGT